MGVLAKRNIRSQRTWGVSKSLLYSMPLEKKISQGDAGDVLAVKKSPVAAVIAHVTVVAHHEILALGHLDGAKPVAVVDCAGGDSFEAVGGTR